MRNVNKYSFNTTYGAPYEFVDAYPFSIFGMAYFIENMSNVDLTVNFQYSDNGVAWTTDSSSTVKGQGQISGQITTNMDAKYWRVTVDDPTPLEGVQGVRVTCETFDSDPIFKVENEA